MADLLAGGGVDRRRAIPGCEVGPVGEAGDVANLDEQPGRAGWSDAVELSECAAGGGEQLAQFLVGRLLALVDPLQVTDQLCSDPAPRLAGRIPGPDRGEQLPGL